MTEGSLEGWEYGGGGGGGGVRALRAGRGAGRLGSGDDGLDEIGVVTSWEVGPVILGGIARQESQ